MLFKMLCLQGAWIFMLECDYVWIKPMKVGYLVSCGACGCYSIRLHSFRMPSRGRHLWSAAQ